MLQNFITSTQKKDDQHDRRMKMALDFDDFNYKNYNENLLNLEQKEVVELKADPENGWPVIDIAEPDSPTPTDKK